MKMQELQRLKEQLEGLGFVVVITRPDTRYHITITKPGSNVSYHAELGSIKAVVELFRFIVQLVNTR